MNLLITLPLTFLLLLRSYTHRSLTPLGLLFATLTALLHSAHPSPLPFTLLCVFFVAGTSATKVKADVKARLTLNNTNGGGAGGETRTHVQVVANSGVASVLVLLYLYHSWKNKGGNTCVPTSGSIEGLFLAGIVANYAAVAADTMSSELGILAHSSPRLITRPWVQVPRGTNGGVTATGLLAAVAGAAVIALTSVLLMPFCEGGARLGPVGRVLMDSEDERAVRAWTGMDKLLWVLAVTVWGALGSVLDSFLGALLQASVVDRRTGKVVEGVGGGRVLVTASGVGEVEKTRLAVHQDRNKDDLLLRRKMGEQPKQKQQGQTEQESGSGSEDSRKLVVGRDWLDNNQINALMAACMSLGGMGVAAWWWGIPLSSLLVPRWS